LVAAVQFQNHHVLVIILLVQQVQFLVHHRDIYVQVNVHQWQDHVLVHSVQDLLHVRKDKVQEEIVRKVAVDLDQVDKVVKVLVHIVRKVQDNQVVHLVVHHLIVVVVVAEMPVVHLVKAAARRVIRRVRKHYVMILKIWRHLHLVVQWFQEAMVQLKLSYAVVQH
jgi:hypothetical protein